MCDFLIFWNFNCFRQQNRKNEIENKTRANEVVHLPLFYFLFVRFENRQAMKFQKRNFYLLDRVKRRTLSQAIGAE